MSEDNQMNDDKYQSKNNLEKIIKLDKKNGNFDLYDKYAKRKLKIRTSQKNQYFNGQYQNEYTLCYFWRHINQIYFKKVDDVELERLEYLKGIIDEPIPSDYPIKYADHISFSSMGILNKINLKQGKQLYYDVLLKHIRLCTQLYNCRDLKNINVDKIYQSKQKCMTKFTLKNMSVLTLESTTLDKLNSKLNDQLEHTEQGSDQIFNQLLEYETEIKLINKRNKKDLTTLIQKASQPEQPFNWFVYPSSLHQQSLQQPNKQGRINGRQYVPQTNNEALLTYLRNSIQQLDYRQTAESINKVVSTMHSSMGYSFGVSFEQALNPNLVTIEEDILLELDKLRDYSLFKFYNIPQKTKYSHIAQNFMGIKQVQQNRLKQNPLANKNLLKDLKANYGGHENESQIQKYEACHHCKLMFRDEYLVSCNYRSGTMGLPIINQTFTDTTFLFAQVDEEGIKSRRQVPNRKKTSYSQYSKKSGELVCSRKFCRQCLKQNYEYNFTEQQNKTDWVCPFCQAICFCSRCQRNDIMIKLKDLYTICGGDLDQLSKDSVFEKYIRPLTEDQSYRKKTIVNQQQQSKQTVEFKKRTGNTLLRQQLNNFKDMQVIRLDFENLRLLCSQVLKREKQKWKLMEQNLMIWDNMTRVDTKIVQKQKKAQTKLKPKINQFRTEDHSTSSVEKSKQQFESGFSSSSSSSSESSEFLVDSKENHEIVKSQKQEKQQQLQQQSKQANGNQSKQSKASNGQYKHILNNYKHFPSKNIKRELAQLLQCQDSDTYSLVVKKIREDHKQNNRK